MFSQNRSFGQRLCLLLSMVNNVGNNATTTCPFGGDSVAKDEPLLCTIHTQRRNTPVEHRIHWQRTLANKHFW